MFFSSWTFRERSIYTTPALPKVFTFPDQYFQVVYHGTGHGTLGKPLIVIRMLRFQFKTPNAFPVLVIFIPFIVQYNCYHITPILYNEWSSLTAVYQRFLFTVYSIVIKLVTLNISVNVSFIVHTNNTGHIFV